MVDNSVVKILTEALEKDPDNVAIRIHLITLLLETEQADLALEQCRTLLTKQPDHVQALELAARAAQMTKQDSLASAYNRMLQALRPQEQPIPENQDEDLQKLSSQPGPLRVFRGSSEESFVPELEKPVITLDDVAGMMDVKKRLNAAFLIPMKNPEMVRMYGKSLRGGLLLYGPPGCGKTFIARAAAGELGAKFIPVGLSDVMDMWLGQSERNLHELFESARRNAPCVLFFDELDALGRKRSLMRHSSEHNIVNQLLAEMDSVQADNRGIFILAATNHPWDVDVALRRPGRLDRILLVLPPDRPARVAVLKLHLRNRPVAEDIDLDWVASRTEDFSGADLAHLCESAAELAMEDAIQNKKPRPITFSDMKKALKEIKPSSRSWFETAKNYAMFANDGGIYDELVSYLRLRRFI